MRSKTITGYLIYSFQELLEETALCDQAEPRIVLCLVTVLICNLKI